RGVNERERVTAGADAKQHSDGGWRASWGRRTMRHRGAGSVRTPSGRRAGGGDRGSWWPGGSRPVVLSEPEEVAHHVSIDQPVGADRRLLHPDRREMQELVTDLGRDP